MHTDLVFKAEALRLADRVTSTLARHEQVLRDHGLWEQVREIAAGGVLDQNLPGGLPFSATTARAARLDSAITRLWATSGRAVVAFHPALLEVVMDAQTGAFPAEVFQKLPCRNPLVLFPEPLPMISTGGETCRMAGFYVFGTTAVPGDADRRLSTTDSPTARALGFMFVCDILDPAGKVIDTDITRVSVPLDGAFTLEAAIEATRHAYEVDWTSLSPTSTEATRRWITECTTLALTTSVYLCARDADLEEVRPRQAKPKRAKDKTNRTRPAKPLRVYTAGFRAGPEAMRSRAARIASGVSAEATAALPTRQRYRLESVRVVPDGPGEIVFNAPSVNSTRLEQAF